jgi:hypothetical protein
VVAAARLRISRVPSKPTSSSSNTVNAVVAILMSELTRSPWF